MINTATRTVIKGQPGAVILDPLGGAVGCCRRGAAPGRAGNHRGPKVVDRHLRAALGSRVQGKRRVPLPTQTRSVCISGHFVRTIDQQIADAQAKLARLKTRQKASDTRRKIIVGAIVTTEALKDPKIARWLASSLRKNATREVDQKEIAGLLADLDARAQSAGAGEA